MAVGIEDKGLLHTVGPCLAWHAIDFPRIEMSIPRVEIIDRQRDVCPAMMRPNRFASITDQVQFLRRSQSEPRTRKIKRRPRKRLKLQRIGVKSRASGNVRDMQGNVVQFANMHYVDTSA